MVFIWADYLVCGITLAVSSAIGIYYRFTGGKQKTTKEFLLANSSANMVVVACSLMATFMSSITLLGVPSEIYTFGTQFVLINIAYGLFSPLAAHFYIPVFYKLKAVSAFEYLEKRFGVVTRMVASLAFCVQMIFYMGIVVYAPALALEAVTGIGYIYAIFIIGCVCTFYAGLGGMKAVLVTDVFQTLLMFCAVFSVIISALVEVGMTEIWSIAYEHGRIEFFNFNLDPTTRHTWWSVILGGGFTFLSLFAVNQAQVQRYLSVKSLKEAQISLYINWPILTFLSLCTSFAGLAIFSKYYNCDPLLTKRITSSDQLMPRYVLDTMSKAPGVSGLFVAGIFSGSLSTMSSALNSLAAVTVEDYVKPAVKYFKKRNMEESTASICTKFLSLFFGCFCLAFAFMARYLGAVLQASLIIFGVVGGPVLGVYTLGMFIPFANEVGALTGLVISLCFGFWFGFGGPKPPPPALPTWSSKEACAKYDVKLQVFKNSTAVANGSDYMYLYRLSYQWYIVISFTLCLGIGVLVSWIAKKMKYEYGHFHPDLFIPQLNKYLTKKKIKTDVQQTGSGGSNISLNRVSRKTENGAEKAPEKRAERAPEKGAEKAPEKGAERAPEKGAERAPEKEKQEIPEKN